MYGDGTIIKKADGRLRVRVMVGGRPRDVLIPARVVKADPKAAWRLADQKRRQLVAERDSGGIAPLVEDFLRSWLGRLGRTQEVRYRTLEGYRSIVELQLIPAFGAIRIDRPTDRDVQRWIDEHEGSPRTIRNHIAVLRQALEDALRRHLVPRSVGNVADKSAVRLPKPKEYNGDPLTIDEVRKLLDATRDDHPWGALWALGVDAGFREAELLGLSRDDVDLDAGTVTLTVQLGRRNGEWVFTETKRPRKLATIALADSTIETLRKHMVKSAAERDPSWPYFGLLFTTAEGNPIGSSWCLRQFHLACKKAGIRPRRVHDLRGTSATLMRELGVPEDVRMVRLGHSTTAMARHYAQARPGIDRTAADALGKLLAEG